LGKEIKRDQHCGYRNGKMSYVSVREVCFVNIVNEDLKPTTAARKRKRGTKQLVKKDREVFRGRGGGKIFSNISDPRDAPKREKKEMTGKGIKEVDKRSKSIVSIQDITRGALEASEGFNNNNGRTRVGRDPQQDGSENKMRRVLCFK